MTEEILAACIAGKRLAQKQFYDFFKGKMYVVCLRYSNSREDAEDILQEGFVTVFRDLHQYKGAGHLEGWVRKVFVNVALQHLQKQKRQMPTVELNDLDLAVHEEDIVIPPDESIAKQMIRILQQMPDGFRTIFNLYVLEGYSHPEIADIMGISVGTSKSQLLRAKAYMRKMLDKSLMT